MQVFSDNELTKVTIPEGITRIEAHTFSENKLRKIDFPKSLKEVGRSAFASNKLTEVTLPLHVTKWGSSVFSDNEITKATIPEGIQRIESAMFEMNHLKKVQLPSSLITVGTNAFMGNQLEDIQLPLTVETIEAGAFSSNELTSIDLPESVKTVGTSAFSNNQLTAVQMPHHVTSWGNGVFSSNELKKVTISNGVTKIANNMFSYNELVDVTIPSSVRDIGYDAFLANDLQTVRIESDQVSIGQRAFYTINNPELSCDETGEHCIWVDFWSADKNVIIYGTPSSAVQAYAQENGYTFKEVFDYRVHFDSNGGSEVSSIEAKKNGLLREPPAPTKKGEAFLGWYTDRNLQIPWSFGMDRVNRDFTLYAKWGKQTAPTFKDVENHWSKPFVIEAVEKGILSGYKDNTFRPSNLLTRAQAASILVRALELEATEPSPFEDVKNYAETTQDEIAAAYEHGLVKGYGDQFNPGKTVTRAQFALMIKRAYELENEEVYEPIKIAPFPDIGNYDIEAQTAITLLYDFKIAEGSNGKFNPQNQTKRGHAAKMLVNTLPHIQ